MKQRVFAILLLFILFFASSCPGKSSMISMGEFLSTALQEPTLSTQAECVDLLKQEPEGISFIEDSEFRMSIDKFESNQQKYAFRFKPRTWNEIKTEKEVLMAMVQSGKAELERLLHGALKSRYMSVVDFFYFSEMTNLHKELKLLCEDRQTVLKQYVETLNFDAGELADTESQRIGIEMDLMELKNRQDALTHEIKGQGSYKGHVTLDKSNLIKIERISDQIRGIDVNAGDENIHIWNAKTDAETTEARYRMEYAETKSPISFIKTEYNAADHDDFGNAFSIEFGISLPMGYNSDTALRQRKVAGMKSQNRHREVRRKINHTIPVIQQELHSLIQQYKAIKSKKTEGFTTAAFDRLLTMEGTNPLPLLKLKKSMLETDIILIKLSRMILTKYIDILDISGKLSKKPLINYLTDPMEVISK